MTAMEPKKATFGGGCFWCLEAVFEMLNGVSSVVSGYAGGHPKRATYEAVCSGVTGHAEVIQITFDPGVISFEQLLTVFFAIHDPTTLNRQGADVGTQYRSVIFTHDDDQRRQAERMIARLTEARTFAAPIVTQIVPLDQFFRAEDYHQGYFRANPAQPYCQAVVGQKVKKAIAQFAPLLKSTS